MTTAKNSINARYRQGQAWSFYVGGYQPAQKWLKDRKGRVLDFIHYERIIKALVETEKVMGEINQIKM